MPAPPLPAPPLYGPPPAADQVALAAGPLDQPWAWGLCAAVGLALLGLGLWRRDRRWGFPLALLGQVVLLTAPAAALLERAVWGAWPTLDKAGSFLFYQQGVHRHLFAPGALRDPALKLIGVHVGHLWVTAALDLALSAHAAFNAQALLQIWLAWLCAWLLCRELGARPWAAALGAFPFALGLHVFRDVTWYTIEKSAVFGIPLFLWLLLRARGRGGRWIALAALALASATFLNVYLGLLGGALLALWLLGARDGRALRTAGACALALAPLALVQALLLRGAGDLADPERFLRERAALDVLSFWPPAWYHLELWRALNLPLALLGAWSLGRRRAQPEARFGIAAVLCLTALALGPYPSGLENPLFLAAWKALPGFWRIARPEFFFEGAYLALLAAAALEISERCRTWRSLLPLSALLLAGWLWGVRGHPAFPGFCEPVPVALEPGWEPAVFGGAGPAR